MSNTLLHDRSQVTFKNTSGAYGTASGASGLWIGLVTNHTINEETNVFQNRYAGGNGRNVGNFTLGPLDVTGTIEYIPQTWEFLGYALGSIVEASGTSPMTHTCVRADSNYTDPFTTQILPDVTIIDEVQGNVAGSNFVRTVDGAVINTMTININQGEQITCSFDYIAQNVTYSSGTIVKTAENTDQEFLAEHFKWALPSGTSSVLPNVKSATIVVNNNLQPQHYVTGSRHIQFPTPSNADYTVTLTMDADQSWSKALYDQYFLGGSTFNLYAEATTSIGSPNRVLLTTFSGCIIADMDAPTMGEGIAEHTITVIPQDMYVSATDKRTDYWLVGSHT